MLDIIQAIESKQRVEFLYKGTKRVVEPHLLGLNLKGELMLRAFEISTFNGGLKLFKLSEMADITITKTRFLFAHPTFKAKDKQIIKAMAVIS